MARQLTLHDCDRTDIEQETNGIYNYSRQPKLDVKQVKALLDRVQKTYHEKRAAA